MRRRRQDRQEDQAVRLGVGDECEAFLAGGMVEYQTATGRPIAGWAWLNRLAHARGAELLIIASGGFESDPPPWRDALAYLAREALERAETQGGITQVQRQLLVPLELQLIGDPAALRMRPGELVARVLDVLHGAGQTGPQYRS